MVPQLNEAQPYTYVVNQMSECRVLLEVRARAAPTIIPDEFPAVSKLSLRKNVIIWWLYHRIAYLEGVLRRLGRPGGKKLSDAHLSLQPWLGQRVFVAPSTSLPLCPRTHIIVKRPCYIKVSYPHLDPLFAYVSIPGHSRSTDPRRSCWVQIFHPVMLRWATGDLHSPFSMQI